MRKINIFLASSNELIQEREKFEIEIYRKCKAWLNQDIFLYLDIWEDISSRLSIGGLQQEYNNRIASSDIFVLLAYTKMGMYTGDEFEKAYGTFNIIKKPFIFTYFKKGSENIDESLLLFQKKLNSLKHYWCIFQDSNDLWNQFNKELERLKINLFEKNDLPVISSANTQNANKSYFIDKIEKANFS